VSDWTWKSGAAIADDVAWLDSLGESRMGGWTPRAGAFQDDIWVLHPMYENLTPRVRGGTPGDRVRWSEVWRRNGLKLGQGMTFPPGIMWIVGPTGGNQRDGPFAKEKLILPEEDTMDAETVAALLPRLPGGTGMVHAIWDDLAAARIPRVFEENGGFERIGVHASIADIIEVTSLFGQGLHTPSNFWPEDRSWLVLTEYDLWATQVFGSTELIASLEQAPDLETLRWAPTT